MCHQLDRLTQSPLAGALLLVAACSDGASAVPSLSSSQSTTVSFTNGQVDGAEDRTSALTVVIQRLMPFMYDYPASNSYAARDAETDAGFLFAEWAETQLMEDEVVSSPECKVPAERRDHGSICCVDGTLRNTAGPQFVAIAAGPFVVSGLAARGTGGHQRGDSVSLCGVVTGRLLEQPGPTPIVSGLLLARRSRSSKRAGIGISAASTLEPATSAGGCN